MPLSPPEPLSGFHQTQTFASGEASLDDWLRRRALANQVSGATRTFVVCEASQVIGYYALAAGAADQASASTKFLRTMPDPIPVVLLARLAVNRTNQGRGIGRALFRDAALRVSRAADVIGIRGIVVHAISEAARDFYLSLGFDPCPLEPMTLLATLQNIRRAIP